MNELNEAIETIAKEIGLDKGEIDERKGFLELGADDIAILLQLHDFMQDKEGLSNAFYLHLLEHTDLRTLLPDMATIARLRKSLSGYFEAVTAGDYGHEYIIDRLRVGLVHQRIGLEPKWYIGAYRKFLSELMPKLWEKLQHKPKFFLDSYDALLKIICLDMGLALDTYFHAERQMVLQQRNYLEQIIDGMPAGLIVIDAGCRIRSMNQMMQRMLGAAGRSEAGGKMLHEMIPCTRLADGIRRVLSSGEPVNNLIVNIPSDDAGGASRHFGFNIRKTRQDGEELLLLIAQDITFQLQAQIRLQESEESFRLTFSQAAVGIAHLASDGKMIRVNRKMSEILGYTEQELLQLSMQQLSFPEKSASEEDPFTHLVTGQVSEYARERQYRHKDGHPLWINVTVSSMENAAGRLRYIAVIEDISRRKQIEMELLRTANHDALTGLPNRLLLQDRLAQAIAKARRMKRQVALLFIDLDRFKNINDSLGHEAGDQMIAEIACRLSRSLRESDTVSRQGGDEFVVVLPDIDDANQVAVVAQKILSSLFTPMVLLGQEIFPTASIGISTYPDHGRNPQTLLKNADTAMYGAKSAGGNCYQFYREGMGMKAMDHLKMEGALQRALERQEFLLHYQPQIDIKTGRLLGVEALLRWQPQGKDMVAPGEFIPVAEETGLIVPIGEWVLAAACRQHKAWREAGLPHIRIGVNLSARQFQRADVAKQIAHLLHEQECNADWLALEITESVVMENPDMAADTLLQLSNMGVRLSIDDFGTGYSSLSSLKRFPIHSLKIDHSFVRDISTDADGAIIVKSVIALAHNMKLSVIAEGVETAKQFDFLEEHGCDQMQGYLFSRPVPPEQIAQMLRKPELADPAMPVRRGLMH